MDFQELMRDISHECIGGEDSPFITGIVCDSRRISAGAAFFCIEGMHRDGNDHAAEAVRLGAAALITQNAALPERLKREGVTENVTIALVKDVRRALALASAAWYGNPARELVTIGVTGTKGKTTCTYLIKSILENAGRKVGLIGTNEIIIGRDHEEAEYTTPEAPVLQKCLRRMADEGLDTVVMEVSSQAIKMRRADGIFFDYGIFTNLSPDHVSPGEHKDFREYLECKRELFRRCGTGIVNADDPYVNQVTKGRTCELETFGLGDGCMLRAENVKYEVLGDGLGVSFHIAGQMDFDLSLPMPGKFSVYNALAAICLCRHFRVRESDIQRSALAVKVRGRIERAVSRDGWHVLIDYAHNPAALASLLEALRQYRPGRLICLFGCGGDRPVMRRMQMGLISGKKADLTVITDDNPRNEDPAKIREQIAEGVRRSGGKYVIIPGRREAIRYVLADARAGDLIVLAGKGHESCQEIRGKRIPMDERKIIGEILNEACHTRTSS